MSFNGAEYIEHIGKRLVDEFKFAAKAGTPGLKGSAKEHPARVQLARLMQDGLGVGSGIIVDSFGGRSAQQDIVVYEKISPIFSHSDDPQSTYFPVEGVVACGEVKSVLDASEIKDSFAKCMSVKRLRRFTKNGDEGLGQLPTASFRNYSNTGSAITSKVYQYDQDVNSLDQVMTFVLCERFSALPDTTTSNFTAQFREHGRFAGPNIVVSLNDGFILGHKSQNNSVTISAIDGDGLFFCKQPLVAFSKLVWLLRQYVWSGRTVPIEAYERYFSSRPEDKQFTIDFLEKF